MPFEIERIGVVGASGYIGSALTASLVTNGVLPRLFGRTAGAVSNCEIYALNSDPEQFSGLDCVVHLSAITTSRASERDLRRANIDLAKKTALKAAAAGVKRFVFISSLHVHGKAAGAPVGPTSPFKCDNAYGRSKAEAETALAAIAVDTGLELTIVRPPMVYGPGSKGSFSLLAKLVRTELPLPLGTANAPRSFCSISNVVSAVRHVIAARTPVRVLLPADPQDFDAASMTNAMARAMGCKAMLWSAPRTLLAAPLAMIGRGEMITSLFEPLQIDRAHWARIGWAPPEDGEQAIRTALSFNGQVNAEN